MARPVLIIDRSVCIVVSRTEPYSVQRAAQAVLGDVRDVIPGAGRVAEAAHGDAALAIRVESTGQLAQRFGWRQHLQREEAFVIAAVELDGRPSVVISGAGERGAIFGLYHFAHKHLDADPFKHWTGYLPAQRQRLELAEVEQVQPPPAIRFRGWHLEGIHAFEEPTAAAGVDFHLRFWERTFETLLRCRGNMVKPNSNRPESMPVGLAQRMGLLITQEHCCPLGVGAWDIASDEQGFNGSFDDYPHVFVQAWEDAMQRYPRPESVIWTLGFRGRGDRPFWEADPKHDTDEKRGRQITRIMRIQKELVDKHHGRHNPAFIHNTWMEGNRLVAEGHTTVPEGVCTVWADNGYGTFRSMIAEGCDPEQVQPTLPEQLTEGQHGMYYHVSMWDFNAPFTTQFVPPQRIEAQLGQAVARGMNEYLLVNVGRLRDAVTSAAMIADFWQQPEGWSGQRFMDRWCRRHFGDRAGDAMQCYHVLYHLPFKWGQWGGWDDYVIGDVGYVRRARLFVDEALSAFKRHHYENAPFKFWLHRAMTLAQQLEYMRAQTSAVTLPWQQAHEHALAVVQQLRGASRLFFHADLLSQIAVHRAWNGHLQHMIDAVSAYEEGRFGDAVEYARAGRHHVRLVEDAMRLRAYGWLTPWNTPRLLRQAGLPLARQTADLFINAIEAMTTGREAMF